MLAVVEPLDPVEEALDINAARAATVRSVMMMATAAAV
jgi:hypothetical protein